MSEFEDFKATEFLGDKFLNLCVSIFLMEKIDRNDINRFSKEFLTNKNLTISAQKINLLEYKFDLSFVFSSNYKYKKLASHYEYLVYKIFLLYGFSYAYNFVVQTHLIRIYNELKSK